jgi:serine/threonine protein kinase
MIGILQGVSYIHSKDIIHRDLKPQNLLIGDINDLTTIKLIDFGLGEQHKNSLQSNDEYCGTLTFMAPEVASSKQYTKSVDMWAIGIIMHMVLTGGKHPIYVKGVDTYITFKQKLQSIKKIDADPSLSEIAQSLFKRLTAV